MIMITIVIIIMISNDTDTTSMTTVGSLRSIIGAGPKAPLLPSQVCRRF